MILDVVTMLREEIEKTGIECYSPDLPQDVEKCCSVALESGNPIRSIGCTNYYEIPCYSIIRGTKNDKETRELAQKVFEALEGKLNIIKNNTKIINILCQTPNYAFRDENQRIHYNINFEIKVESE